MTKPILTGGHSSTVLSARPRLPRGSRHGDGARGSGRLVDRLRTTFALDWRGIHGAAHWARVRRNGLVLAERTGASRRVVSLFAFLHDARRENDGQDPAHGRRAASLLDALRAEGLVSLGDGEAGLLAYACRRHSDGLTDADVTVQACWDADRLDLGRVGKRPDPDRLCTPAARDRALIADAYRRSCRG